MTLMNKMLAEIDVRPLYAQVVIQDVETNDLPDWGDGNECLVFTDHSIYVATQPDYEGDVRCTLYFGATDIEQKELVFDGNLVLESGELEFGSKLAGKFARVAVGKGMMRIRIYLNDRMRASEVIALLGG
jgi:hypothetical protein